MGRGGKWAITEFVVERPLTAVFSNPDFPPRQYP